MRAAGIVLFGLVAAGCGAARDVAHVVTAPVRVVHRGLAGDPSPPPKRSDVDIPGRPVAATPTPSPRAARNKMKAPSAQASASPGAQPQFPLAKPVPGRPGLVFNPFDSKGAMIDVSGYAPGSKVKDPDSQKIFVVP